MTDVKENSVEMVTHSMEDTIKLLMKHEAHEGEFYFVNSVIVGTHGHRCTHTHMYVLLLLLRKIS